MKKLIDFFNDGFIRLIIFALFWVFFVIYAIVEKIVIYNVLYYLVLYIPLTLLLLKKSFYFANFLLIVIGVVEIISSVGYIINCVIFLLDEFRFSVIITILYNLISFILYVVMFTYIIIKLRNKQFNELKNNLLAKIVIVIMLIFLVFGIVNVIMVINQDNTNVMGDIFNFLWRVFLLIQEIVFIIISKKDDKLIRDIE